jgi:SH3-like domain-containing protein
MKPTQNLLALVVLIVSSTVLAESGMKSVAKDNVNVRRGPGQNHEIFYKAPLGYPVKVDRTQGDWMLCRDWEGDSGWIKRALLGRLKTVVILGSKINLRQGPGVSQPIAEKTERGRIYRVLRSRDGWHQLGYFDSKEVAGWARADLVWGQ